MKILNTLIAIIVCAILLNCNSVQKSTANSFEAERKLDTELTMLSKDGKLNGNILVARNDKIIYNKSFGFADGTQEKSLKQNHRFNIGSIYKEIPAIAIMQLSEKQLLKLNDPISKYLTELPDWSHQITIQQLLQYTSGLPKISWGKHPEINDVVLMEDLSQLSKLESSAGKQYLYTNYSPFLLSKIVESISKNDFKDYVKRKILKPLNIENSGFNLSFPYQDRSGMAVSFNADFAEDNPPFKIKSSMFLFSTTTEDLYTLVEGLHSNKLINQKSVETISRAANLDSKEVESPLGQIEYKNDEIVSHVHHGSSGNYEGIISVDLKKGITVVVLTNKKSGNVHEIVETITELIG